MSGVSDFTDSEAAPTPVAQPPSSPPPNTVPETSSTSKRPRKYKKPGKYKKRTLSEPEDVDIDIGIDIDIDIDISEEEDVDMDNIEDNNSSGSSVESHHVPAKRLRTSMATRSSKTTPDPEGATEEADLRQVPSSVTSVHNLGGPDTEPALTTPSHSHSDHAGIDTDQPTLSKGVPNTTDHGARHVHKPVAKTPVVHSQPPLPSPESVPGAELKIPEFLTEKQDIYDYLSSIKETHFHDLLKVYITFERTNRVPIRGLLSTYRRPKAIGWWTSRARPLKLPVYDSLKSFTDSIITWWVSLQPDWRKIRVDEVARAEGNFDDWERLYQPGTNGLLNVIILAHWWARILEERESPVDDAYTWFVSDVSWVLSQLTSVAADAHE